VVVCVSYSLSSTIRRSTSEKSKSDIALYIDSG
jgi:hypothetical protein